MKSVLVAAVCLTRMPLTVSAGAADVGQAARWFPLIGGALGGATALLAWLMHERLAFPAGLTAALLVGLAAWATGAMHLDGLADTADGFGGGRTREDALRIMRDPAIGAFGAAALVIVVVTKAAAVSALLEHRSALPFLIAAPAISRWTIPVLAASLPYARAEGGLGQAVMPHGMTGLLVSTVVTALVVFPAAGMDALLVWAPALLTTAWMARAARRRIGGVTGDVFGASVELTETVVLLTGVLVTRAA